MKTDDTIGIEQKRINSNNFTIDQREEVIKKYDVSLEISKFFGLPTDSLSVNSNYKSYHQFSAGGGSSQYNETSKFGVLFSSKCGSSALLSILNENELSIYDHNSNSFIEVLQSWTKGEEIPKDSEYSEFCKILNGTSKKDLIVIIRNPIYKFLSGIYQDISLDIERSDILYNLMREKYNADNVGKNSIDNLPDEAISELAFMYIKNLYESHGHIAHGHVAPVNEKYFNLLMSSNVNKSKIKIIDIDNPNYVLFDVIKEYYPNLKDNMRINNFWSHRHKHKLILEGLDKHINETKKFVLKSWLKRQVLTDLTYYSLIKKNYKEYEPK